MTKRIWAALCAVLAALMYLYKGTPEQVHRVISPAELAEHDLNHEQPWLCLLGQVFDVSSGKQYYAKGGGYAFFSGRDASRAFVTGDFQGEGLTDNVEGLKPADIDSLRGWLDDTYHSKYKYLGRLHGRYYDANGQPTQALRSAMATADQVIAEREAEKKLKEQFPGCSSKYSREKGSEIWCKEPRVPRIMSKNGKAVRCACAIRSEAEARPDLFKLYDDCAPDSTLCVIPPKRKK